MLLDGNTLLETQLTLTQPAAFAVGDGRTTTLTPVRQTPCPEGRAISLDGVWQVCRWPFPVSEARLAAPGTTDGAWETIQQPGKVLYADPEAECATIPNWDRVTQTHIDDDDGAMIRRSMAIPAEWNGKRIMLRFDAIYPAGRVYLDGDLLGEHLSGLTPVEFDVTAKVKPGLDAWVAVRLLRKHTFHKMDMVRHALEFAGLAQSACLFTVEPVMVEDYHLTSALNTSFDRGSVEGTISLRNHGGATTADVAVTLLDDAGRVVASADHEVAVPACDRAAIRVALAVDAPRLWNDEFPNLYTVRVVLTVPGQAAQTIAYRTGFRRLDLSPAGPRLNGMFVKFRGVNHLTFHPEHGMHTPREWLRRCLSLMKKANVNAIRTHFLGPRDLADLCDEMGLYLMQELPIDWGTHYIHDPEWVGPALMRIEGGIRRDRHHPCIMVWSIGNENLPESTRVADDGWNHMRIYDRFAKRLDPSRPTMFPPPGPANTIRGIFETRVGDVADTHYSFELVKAFLRTGRLVNPRSWEADFEECTREEAIQRGWSGVWFSSEWGIQNMIPDLLNAPHGSIIDDAAEDLFTGRNALQVFQDRLEREWGFMRGEPTCLGGAYFPWISCAVGKGPDGNPWGWMRHGEDADWGVVCADLTPKPFFWALRVAYSPVRFPSRLAWRKGQNDINFDIENQFNRIDLAQCILRVQFQHAGKWMTMMRAFIDVPVACPPGGRTTVHLPLPGDAWREHLDGGKSVLVRCTLLDPRGFRVVVAEILVLSGETVQVGDQLMPVGPDAIL